MGKQTTTASGTLAGLGAGSCFTYGGVKWVALEQGGGLCLCIAHDILPETRAFDMENRNDFALSTLKNWLGGDFLAELVAAGAVPEAFEEMSLDLTAEDGLDDYGTDHAKIALISCDQYRRFRKLIPNASDWWWTLTPYSTASNGYSRYVRIVLADGTLGNSLAYNGNYGVRPLCSLKSSILVSYEPDEATPRDTAEQ